MAGGKYEKEIVRFLASTQCKSLIAIIVEGNRGSSMAIEVRSEHTPNMIAFLREALKDLEIRFPAAKLIADSIQLKAGSDLKEVRHDAN